MVAFSWLQPSCRHVSCGGGWAREPSVLAWKGRPKKSSLKLLLGARKWSGSVLCFALNTVSIFGFHLVRNAFCPKTGAIERFKSWNFWGDLGPVKRQVRLKQHANRVVQKLSMTNIHILGRNHAQNHQDKNTRCHMSTQTLPFARWF